MTTSSPFLFSTLRTLVLASMWCVAAFLGVMSTAGAQPTASRWDPMIGEWRGTYTCGSTTLGVTFKVTSDGQDGFNATFAIHPSGNLGQEPSGVFAGRLRSSPNRIVSFEAGDWIQPSPKYAMIGFEGAVTPDGRRFIGRIGFYGCQRIEMTKMEGDVLAAAPTPGAAPQRRPDLIRALPGRWDGAVYPHVNNAEPIRRMSIVFSIRPDGNLQTRRLDRNLGDTDLHMGASGNYVELAASPIIPGARPDQSFRLSFIGDLAQSIVRDAAGRQVLKLSLRYGQNVSAVYLLRRTDPDVSSDPCVETVDPWFEGGIRAVDTAKALRVRFFPTLNKYDPIQAALMSMLTSGPFGAGPTSLADADTLKAALARVRDCVLTVPEPVSASYGELLGRFFDNQAIANERRSMRPPFEWRPGRWESLVPRLSLEQALWLIEKMRVSEAALPEAVLRVSSSDNLEGIDARLRAVVPEITSSRPATLNVALATVATRRDQLQKEAVAEAQARREAAAKARMQGINFPATAIPTNYRESVRNVAEGRATSIPTLERAYYGGLVESAVTDCELPRDARERASLMALLTQAAGQVTTGTDYSSQTLEAALRSQFQSDSTYLQGVVTTRAIGCNDRFLPAMLTALAELTEVAERGTAGSAPMFIRTCAQERTQQQCECIIRVGGTVMGSIAQQTYSPGLIQSLVQRSPMAVAGQLMANCGVIQY